METEHFLPMTRDEMDKLGWPQLDVLLVTGDAYIDHHSFGVAIIGRVLLSHGYKVGIIAQPDWNNPKAFEVMGRPRFFCGVTAGNLDSILAHYTAAKKIRHDDAYTPDGKAGARPDYAVNVYTGILKFHFPVKIHASTPPFLSFSILSYQVSSCNPETVDYRFCYNCHFITEEVQKFSLNQRIFLD